MVKSEKKRSGMVTEIRGTGKEVTAEVVSILTAIYLHERKQGENAEKAVDKLLAITMFAASKGDEMYEKE